MFYFRLTKLVGGDQVGLPGDHPLAVVVPAGAEAAVEVEGVAVLEILRSTDSTNTVTPGRAHIGQTQDAALKLDVSEQVRKTEVLVGVLPGEHLQ